MARGRAFLLIISALLLAGALSAQTAGTVTSTTYTSPTPAFCTPGGNNALQIPSTLYAISISMLALMLSIAVVALGYMLSKVFPTSGIRNWLSTEYWELAKSFLLIICIYAVITFIASIGVTITGTLPSSGGVYAPGNGYFADIGTLYSEDNYYVCIASSYLASGWDFIGEESIAIGILQGSDLALWLPIPIPFPPFVGSAFTFGFDMHPYQNYMLESGNVVIQHFESTIYDMTQVILFPVTIILTSMNFVIPILITIGLMFLIPMGLIFRAFPFVRGIGGTLIALGIGVAVVFPTLLVLFNAPISNGLSQFAQIQTTGSGACSGFISCTLFNVLEGTLNNVATIFKYAWDAWFGIYPFYNNMLAYNFYMVVQLILFAFDLLIMYVVTDNIAKALGGTIRLSLGSKMRIA